MVFKRPPDIKIHTTAGFTPAIIRPNGKILQINSKAKPQYSCGFVFLLLFYIILYKIKR